MKESKQERCAIAPVGLMVSVIREYELYHQINQDGRDIHQRVHDHKVRQ